MKKLAFIKRSNGSHWVGDGFPVKNIFSDVFPRSNTTLLEKDTRGKHKT